MERIPNWLIKVPAGEYTVYELMEITEEKRSNVQIRMNMLQIEKRKKIINSRWMNVYIWQGAEYYLTRSYNENLNKIRR